MRKSIVVGILLMVLSVSMMSSFSIPPARASGVIVIRADGSIDPPTAPIQRDGEVYVLTGDITSDADGIVIERDNIVVDGGGHTVQGPVGWGRGLSLFSNNITIRNTTVRSFLTGIFLNTNSGNSLLENNITDNEQGISFFLSSNNALRNNRFINNTYGFGVTGRIPSDYVNEVDTSNTIDGKPIYYLVNENDKVIPPNAGCVALVNCINITVQNLSLTKNYGGILLVSTSRSKVVQNTVTDSQYGIYLYESPNNTVSNNNMTDNNQGILLRSSPNNTLFGNNMTRCWNGIYLTGSSNNTLRGNRMADSTLSVEGYSPADFVNDIDASNIVSEKPICYLVNKQHTDVPPDAGYVALVNCTNMRVQNLNLTNRNNGILLAFTSHTIITKNNMTNNVESIRLYSSSDISIYENTIAANNLGVRLDNSSGNAVYGNNIIDNSVGIELYQSFGNMITGNKIEGSQNIGVSLYSSSNNNSISGNNIADNSDSIFISYSTDNCICDNDIEDNDGMGIGLYSSSNNTIHDNNFRNNIKAGALNFGCIYLSLSSNNGIYGNNITENGRGIYLSSSSDNVIHNNNVAYDGFGIELHDSSFRNTVYDNNIESNQYGVLGSSSNNTVFHNNFLNNTIQVYDNTPEYQNFWDNGCEGNYWSDYNGTEFDTYGIGSSPYVIDASNADTFPLKNPYMCGDANHDARANIVDITIIAKAFASQTEDLNWDPHADLDGNGKINIVDITTAAKEFGKEWVW